MSAAHNAKPPLKTRVVQAFALAAVFGLMFALDRSGESARQVAVPKPAANEDVPAVADQSVG